MNLLTMVASPALGLECLMAPGLQKALHPACLASFCCCGMSSFSFFVSCVMTTCAEVSSIARLIGPQPEGLHDSTRKGLSPLLSLLGVLATS